MSIHLIREHMFLYDYSMWATILEGQDVFERFSRHMYCCIISYFSLHVTIFPATQITSSSLLDP
jgi:hypothetical protein